LRNRAWEIWRKKEQEHVDHLWQLWKEELAMDEGPIKPVKGPKPNKGFEGDWMRQSRYWNGS